jgi:hypothetical protein
VGFGHQTPGEGLTEETNLGLNKVLSACHIPSGRATPEHRPWSQIIDRRGNLLNFTNAVAVSIEDRSQAAGSNSLLQSPNGVNPRDGPSDRRSSLAAAGKFLRGWLEIFEFGELHLHGIVPGFPLLPAESVHFSNID